jgi:glycosyltransferase domain-containing protein
MINPIEMHDLTILLTLKNREVYTKNWLERNIFPEFSYLIADGSDCDVNRHICLPYVSHNVTYVQYPPDLTYRIYIQKRMAAMSRIGTRFVLSADNDDFLLRDGLNEIVAELKRSPDITLIQGNVGMVQINDNGFYKRTADWKHFLGDHGDKLPA